MQLALLFCRWRSGRYGLTKIGLVADRDPILRVRGIVELVDALARQQTENTICTEQNVDRVLRAFAGSPPSQWPDLVEERKVWLAGHVSRLLFQSDAIHKVEWLSELQVRFPGPLRLASQLAAHYGLPVEDDVLLVHALLALEPSILSEYHRKRPLSLRALSEVERLLADPGLPTGAVSHFVSFVQNAKLESPGIYESLRTIAVSENGTDMNRNWAASVLTQTACPVEVLVSARREAKDSRVQTILLDALTERQHLATIFERLNRLPANDTELAAFERPFPESTELQWIGKIRATGTWNTLAELRRRVLRLSLPNLAGIVESALARIDKAGLIGLMGEQLPDTPEPWREYTVTRMAEYERESRFEQAASITFDEALAHMADVGGDYRIRLLCEGLTDEAVFRFLLDCAGLGTVSTHSVGGWGNVRSPLFDIGPYIDGFQYAVLVLDGDNGRDLAAAERPIRPEIQQSIGRVQSAGVPVRILLRYGVENYFSQGAFEKVLGRDLSGSFPLDETRPVSPQIGGFDKNLNVEVIKHMQAADFDGTDIAEILAELRERAKENS